MKNRATLEERNYIDGIMHKAVRGKLLTFVQRLTNRLISSVRYRVEQGIGTLKRGIWFLPDALYRTQEREHGVHPHCYHLQLEEAV